MRQRVNWERRHRGGGLAHDTPEPEIVAHLFKLYADKSKE